MTYFREVQYLARNPVVWIAVGVTGFVIARTLTMPEVQRAGALGTMAVLPALVMAWLLLTRLETEVREDGVRLRFRYLWFPKVLPWDQIQSAEAVRYRPLVEYGGWGIRRGWGGNWAWNVYGSRGVLLRLNDGKSFLIGSAQADSLADAIRRRMGR